MRYFSAILFFLIWAILTLGLSLTIFGIIIAASEGWFEIPDKILHTFER